MEVGTKAYRPRKKPLLMKQMHDACLKWAKEPVSWTLDQWNQVIFSEDLHGSDGISYVQRRRGEEFHPDSSTNCEVPRFTNDLGVHFQQGSRPAGVY